MILAPTDRAFDPTYYCHESIGTVVFDPGKGTGDFDPWWVILRCDTSIVDYYARMSLGYGRPVTRNKLWGSHISVIKGEVPTKLEAWGKDYGAVKFYYAHYVRCDNNCHAWVDVWCDKLHELRSDLGLPPKTKMSFHLTIGRLA